MRTPHSGRHETGQNFLVDKRVVGDIVDLVAATDGPIVEIGSGGGALTVPLESLGRRLTAVEIDPRQVAALRPLVGPRTRIINRDFLAHRLPDVKHTVVGNLPFHQTTAILRRLLHAPGWEVAILVTQWEVARRRAGVGGATMMTAQWWPFFDFRLHRRIPAAAFRPRPGVDGGLLSIERRAAPLIEDTRRGDYQRFVHRVFTGRGRGLTAVTARIATADHRAALQEWLRHNGLDGPRALPKDLDAAQWVELFGILGDA